MEIRTSKEISIRCIALTNNACRNLCGQAKIYFTKSVNNQRWCRVSQFKERINHIRDVIRECSFEDDFGEQSFHYSDLNNLFKILKKELNKPEVDTFHNNQQNKPCEVSLNSSQT